MEQTAHMASGISHERDGSVSLVQMILYHASEYRRNVLLLTQDLLLIPFLICCKTTLLPFCLQIICCRAWFGSVSFFIKACSAIPSVCYQNINNKYHGSSFCVCVEAEES